jgi:hypothetical protein
VTTMGRAAWLLAMALSLSACAIPGGGPGRGSVGAADVQALQTVPDTRIDVLMRLGAPDRRLQGDRVFGYLWYEALGSLIVPAGYQVGALTFWSKRMLLVAFDGQGRVVRAEVVGAMSQAGLEDAIASWVDGGKAKHAR